MRLPKYQWLMTEPVQECGFCDNVFVSQNGTGDYQKQIQLELTTSIIEENFLATNPFDEITSTTLTFDRVDPTFTSGQFQLYIGDKIYIFTYGANADVIIGNVYFIGITAVGAGVPPTGILTALNNYVDVNHGTTSSRIGDSFTIIDMPAGSYFQNNGMLDTVTGTTPSGFNSDLFYYTDDSLCFYRGDLTVTTQFFEIEQALTAGSNYIIQIPYQITSLGIETTITIDDGTNPPTTFTPDTTTIGGTIELNYEAVLSSTHTIKIELTDVNSNTDGICFESITIQEIALIDTVEYEDCDGNIVEVDFNTEAYAESYFNGDTYNVVLMDNFPTVFRIIITDTDANVITSRWYQVYNGTDCEYGKLYDIKWTSDCTVGELDYGFTGQINQLYLNGVKIKNQLEVLDSVENVTADGRKRSIYKNTVSQYELRLHPYLASTMDTIERIFDHKTITVDGTQYYVTDVFQVSEVDLGIYTGRVDMYEDGSELIVSDCCC